MLPEGHCGRQGGEAPRCTTSRDVAFDIAVFILMVRSVALEYYYSLTEQDER